MKDLTHQLEAARIAQVEHNNANTYLESEVQQQMERLLQQHHAVKVATLAYKEAEKNFERLKEEKISKLKTSLEPLETSILALNNLDKASLSEIRRYQRPPAQIMTLLSTLALVINVAPDWSSIKQALSDVDLLPRLTCLHKTPVSLCFSLPLFTSSHLRQK